MLGQRREVKKNLASCMDGPSPKIASEPDVTSGGGDNSYHRDGGEEYGNSKRYSPSNGYEVKDTYHPAPEPSYERDIGKWRNA